jgi:DNA-binding NarL/FixJ family response regulator
MVTIALVDDHNLVIHAIKHMIHQHDKNFRVISKAYNGREFISQLQANILPDIAFIDINMPVMDGISTTQFVSAHYPSIKVIGLSATHDYDVINKMAIAGAVGFITKNDDPEIFWKALHIVNNNGTFFHKQPNIQPQFYNLNHLLSEREKEFLALCATEMTYKEIAGRIGVKPRTVENYRRSLFEKLNIVSRTGLSLYAVQNGLVVL